MPLFPYVPQMGARRSVGHKSIRSTLCPRDSGGENTTIRIHGKVRRRRARGGPPKPQAMGLGAVARGGTTSAVDRLRLGMSGRKLSAAAGNRRIYSRRWRNSSRPCRAKGRGATFKPLRQTFPSGKTSGSGWPSGIRESRSLTDVPDQFGPGSG
jgi:hypothetical protein